MTHPVGSTLTHCCAYCGATKSLATITLAMDAHRLLGLGCRQKVLARA